MKKFLLLTTLFKSLLFLILPVLSFAQNNLEKKTLIGNKIEILVPQSFHEMTSDEYKIKYPNPNRKASLILTDKDLEVNLVIDHLIQYPLAIDQVEEFRNQQLSVFKSKKPDSKLLSTGIKEVNSKKIAYIKMLTKASDQNVFICFAFTNLEDKVLLLSFNCTEKLQPIWETLFDAMLSSYKELK